MWDPNGDSVSSFGSDGYRTIAGTYTITIDPNGGGTGLVWLYGQFLTP